MPNGMPDRPLMAPRLVELTADVFAEQISLLGYEAYRKSNNSVISWDSDVFSHLPPDLPRQVSQAIFDALRRKWNQRDHIFDFSHDTLAFHVKQLNYPLTSIDLTGVMVSDRLLSFLLRAQANTLQHLNLSETTGLSSYGINYLLSDDMVTLPALKSFTLTSAEILRVPTTKRYVRRPSVRYTNFALPVVSEGDLRDSLEINISDDDSASKIFHRYVRRPSVRYTNFALPVVSEGDLRDSLEINISDDDSASTSEKLVISAVEDQEDEEIPDFVSFAPNLSHLCLLRGLQYDVEDETPNDFLLRNLNQLSNVRTLDLSEWQSLENLRCLHPLTTLTSLILYDCPDIYRALDTIVSLENLIHLDISQSNRETGVYPKPVTALHSIATSLQNLQYLDISGTNLTAAPSENDRPYKGTGTILSDIPGLCCLRRQLKFLGIFNCDNASNFRQIPAEYVCGDSGEQQLLLALQVYKQRPKIMQSVLNESYQLYRFGDNLKHHVDALHLVLDALRLHIENSTLQIAGSASMFYIIRNVKMNRDTKREVIRALLDGMETHMEEQVMVRNCALSLCQFEIPQDIVFDYARVAKLLVNVLQAHNADNLTQRIVVFLLNSMACHVEGDQKLQVGDIGAIEIILDQIRRKHASGHCDDVMEVGWSFLWNITDETPVNCERFLRHEGLRLFQVCYAQFPNETELVRNMMGLIGNIAEVETLRGQLMHDEYINIFSSLLRNISDGIEISYNSAGVLAHLVSDGDEAWKSQVNISRDKVMKEIIEATKTWDLTARRYINYRSFKPILRLIPMFESSGSQHWAVWALANLTTTDGAKYCRYVCEEGGIGLLELVVYDESSPARVRDLAKLVLRNIEIWQNGGNPEDSMAYAQSLNGNSNDVEMVPI
uniref:Uncharacterized protein n=1 Tax=Acrobeloides nanus TaxID=290746 RepID=A0A914CRH3_9BILA